MRNIAYGRGRCLSAAIRTATGNAAVGDVARKTRDAGGPEAADQHVIEAHARDVRERVGSRVERADEAGVAEVQK